MLKCSCLFVLGVQTRAPCRIFTRRLVCSVFLHCPFRLSLLSQLCLGGRSLLLALGAPVVNTPLCNMCVCAHLRAPALRSGTGRLLDAEASLTLSARQPVQAAAPGRFSRRLRVRRAASVAGRRLFESILPLQLREASLQTVPVCPGRLHGVCPGAGHQAVNRQGGPGLDHVDPPDGDEEAQGPAGLLGVQGEVTQQVVSCVEPRVGRGCVGQTHLVNRLQRHHMDRVSTGFTSKNEHFLRPFQRDSSTF